MILPEFPPDLHAELRTGHILSSLDECLLSGQGVPQMLVGRKRLPVEGVRLSFEVGNLALEKTQVARTQTTEFAKDRGLAVGVGSHPVAERWIARLV